MKNVILVKWLWKGVLIASINSCILCLAAQTEAPEFDLRDVGIASIWTGGTPVNETKESVRVIQGYMNWNDIEVSRGVYNWTVLDNVLNRAKSLNKPVVLQINAKTPAWMENHVPYMGFITRGAGYPAYQFYHPNYISIYKELIEAFAVRIDNDTRKNLVAGVRIQNNAFNTEAWNWEYNNDEMWNIGFNALGGNPDDPARWPTPKPGVTIHYPLLQKGNKSIGIEYLKEIITAHKTSFHTRGIRTFARFELQDNMGTWLNSNYWNESYGGSLITNFRMWYKGTDNLYILKNLCENGLVSYIEDTKGTDVGYPNQPPSRNMDIYWRQVLKLHSRVTYAATYGPDLNMIGNKAWDESFAMVNRYAGLHNLPQSSTGAFIVFCNFNGVGSSLYTVNNVGYFLTQSNNSTTNLSNYGTLTHPYGHSVKKLTGNTLDLGLNADFAGYIRNSKVQVRITFHDQENDEWILKIHNGTNLSTLTEIGTVDEGNNWKTVVYSLNSAPFPGNGVNDLVIEKTGSTDPVFHKVEILLDGEPNQRGDVEKPTAPSNLVPGIITKNTVNLSWDPSFDAVGVTGYLVYLNDELAAEVTNTNTALISLNCSSNYNLYVKARDDAGNLSENSNVINVETETCTYSDILYSENFDDNLAQDWVADSADKWSLANGKYSTVRGGLFTSIYHGLKFQNYIFKADAFPYFHNDFGVIFDFIDNDNHYIMILDADPKTARLVKVENGVSSIVATSTYTIGGYQQPHNIVVKNSGTEVLVTVNGTVVFNNIPITLSDSAKIGLWVERNPVDFDNIEVFKISPVDSVAPTKPANITLISSGENFIHLGWTASTDSAGIAAYRVYKNNRQATTTTFTSVDINGLDCDSMYTFYIIAVDINGNHSDTSEIVYYSTTECSDTVPPTSPTGLIASNVKRNSVKLHWNTASDNDTVVAYNIYINDLFETAYADTAAIIYGLDCSTTYAFTLKSKDKTGNLSAGSTINVTTGACADLAPPTAPADLTATSVSRYSFNLRWSASDDNVGVSGYNINLNEALKLSVTDTFATVTDLLCNTSYNVTVTAFDAGDNFSEASDILVVTTADCPDTFPPSIPANLDTLSTDHSSCVLVWNASSDNIGVVGYDVMKDGILYGSTSDTTITIAGMLCDQDYSFTVKAIDASGNISGTSSPLIVTLDCISGYKNLKDVSKQIEIYPLPFHSELNIDFKESSGYCLLNIYNITGILVYSERISNTDRTTLNLSNDLPAGLYMMKFSFENTVYAKKVIKQ
jgi:chitodextrinase